MSGLAHVALGRALLAAGRLESACHCVISATGHIADIDPDETARALVWLNESYLRDALGRAPTADPATVVDVIERIWIATLYGRPPRETASSSR